MPMTKEEKEQVLDEIKRTGLKRGANLGEIVVPDDYPLYQEKVERETVTIDCPESGVPVTCYIFTAKDKMEKCPVHINIHGGGFFLSHFDKDDMYCARVASETHGIVVDIDYATTADYAFPVAFQQCYAAAAWTFGQCAAWGADEKRVSIGGQSAGGTLSAAVCLRAAADDTFPGKLCMQILNFAGIDMYETLHSENPRFVAFAQLYADGDEEVLKNPYASPIYAPDEMLKNQPYSVIISAGLCPFRDRDEEYGMRLVTMGNEVTMRRFVNSRHAFTIGLVDEWEESQKFIIRCINER